MPARATTFSSRVLRGAERRETWSTVVAVLIAVGVGVYGLVADSEASKAARYLPLLGVVLVFLVVLAAFGRQADRLEQVVDQRLPATEYVESRAELEAILRRAVESAHEYIVAVGGRSRSGPYLATIEARVRAGDLAYWRLLLSGQEPSVDVEEHIRSLAGAPRAHVATLVDLGYPQITVTEATIVIALPVPGHGGLLGLHVPDENAARRLFAYLMEVAQAGTREARA